MMEWLAAFWRYIRTVSSDDAYEQYLRRHAATHPGVPPLSRRDFFIEYQQQKWTGVNRCC